MRAHLPRISVIIAVRNGAATLERALTSVFEQTHPDVELVVMDGASTDGTQAILEQHSDRIAYWESRADRGIYHAWNKALDHVTGEWICFLGADDRFAAPDVLTTMAEDLAAAPAGCRVAYAAVQVVDGSGATVRRIGEPWSVAGPAFSQNMSLPHPATLHRRDLFEERGAFDERFRIAGDYEFLLRELPENPPHFVPGLVAVLMGAGGLSDRPESTLTLLSEVHETRRRHGLARGAPWTSWEITRARIRARFLRVFGEQSTLKVGAAYREVAGIGARVRRRLARVAPALRRAVDAAIENPRRVRQLREIRAGRDVCWTDEDAREPLVTIRIATRDRPTLLVDRAISSALGQTYRNLEILVVGDGASRETEDAVADLTDPRIRFVNLPATTYPSDPDRRWMVQAHAPWNHGLEAARGAWITSLDDDDELTPDHVEILLGHAIRQRLEFVYGDAAVPQSDGSWGLIGEWPPRYAHITHGSFLYSTRLRFLRYDDRSWRFGEPADWNLIRRMRDCGVRMGYVQHVVYRYYPARIVPDARALA